MTKEQLKLRCYELVGDVPIHIGNRMEEAKDLYEWVTKEDRVSKCIKHALKGGIDISEDLKGKAVFMEDASCYEKASSTELHQEDGENLEEYLEEWVNMLTETPTYTETLIISDEDYVEFNFKGEDIIVARSLEAVPELTGKSVYLNREAFEDKERGITYKIIFIG